MAVIISGARKASENWALTQERGLLAALARFAASHHVRIKTPTAIPSVILGEYSTAVC